jgi:hypothetical protein
MSEMRELSRRNWNSIRVPEVEYINCGALLRIADSLEKIERPYAKLLEDLKWSNNQLESYRREVERLANVNAGLRGQITKLKKQIKP